MQNIRKITHDGGKTMPQKTARLSIFALIVYNLTGGRIQMNSAEDPVGLLALTTTGRKSGQPREVSLVYIKSGSAYVIAGSNAGRDKHPGWYFNLRSNQEVTVQIQKQRFKAIAEIAGSEQRKPLWEQLVEASPMFARYEKNTRREIPMVLLHPEG
jgi:deazaflavin-dependent oxidoreductase (nitroreductase family)